jgi:hypothetical protein
MMSACVVGAEHIEHQRSPRYKQYRRRQHSHPLNRERFYRFTAAMRILADLSCFFDIIVTYMLHGVDDVV